MDIAIAVALFLVGTGLIIKGGDIFIDAAGWMSDVSGISKAVIGATVVSLATTAPEYTVSLIAVLKGFNDLSVGNAVGSLICNLGVAFALLAILTPGKVDDRVFGVKGLVMIVAAALLLVFCKNGLVTAAEGLGLVAVFVFFTILNIRFSRDGEQKRKRRETNRNEIIFNILKFVGGAAGIVIGSNLIVDNARTIASTLGVSDAVIGLTVVAIGTSLPEIVTSVAAIVKKQSALSIGNIIGANILDATLILATGSIVSSGGLAVPSQTVTTHLPVTLLLMVLAVLPTAVGRRIYRWQGALIIAVYTLYLAYTVVA